MNLPRPLRGGVSMVMVSKKHLGTKIGVGNSLATGGFNVSVDLGLPNSQCYGEKEFRDT